MKCGNNNYALSLNYTCVVKKIEIQVTLINLGFPLFSVISFSAYYLLPTENFAVTLLSQKNGSKAKFESSCTTMI